jgi:hypothetical protein
MQLRPFTPPRFPTATAALPRFGAAQQASATQASVKRPAQQHQWKNEATGQPQFLGYYDHKPVMGGGRLNVVG